MKVVVTGGAGFIGANLSAELVRRGHHVVVLDDLSTSAESTVDALDVELMVGSVLDPDAVAAACHGAASIVHLAAVPSVARSLKAPRRSHDVNVTGTLAVLDAARDVGAHLVVASSSSVYGRNPTQPRSEDLAPAPASPYAASKLAAETYALAYQESFGLRCLAVRFFNVFGPLQRYDHAYAAVLPAFIHAGLTGEPLTIHGDGEQSRDFTFVDTVVEILADSVDRAVTSRDPVNVAFGTRTTVNEAADMVSELLRRPLPVVHLPERPGDVRHATADSGKLRTLFPGVRPVPLRTGLSRTIAWQLELTGTPAGVVP